MAGVVRFTELRAWDACTVYKRAIYRLVLESPLCRDWTRREQLEQSVAGPPANIAEGYGRFNPPDFARFAVIARASLMESQSHLIDAVDKGYISQETHDSLNALAKIALAEVSGLIDYLQSPEALRNARRARERRIANRDRRLAERARRNDLPNPECTDSDREPRPGTVNPNREPEP